MDINLLADEGLILYSAIRSHLDDSRALTRLAERGQLVRLRRGAFVPTDHWNSIDGRQQHLLRVRAVVASAQRPPVIAGLSAAAIWGMPIAVEWPTDVTLLDEWLGGGRSEVGVRRTAAGHATAMPVLRDGFMVTSLARTALYVASRFDLPMAIGSLDWALHEKNPERIDKWALAAELELLSSAQGKKRMAAAVAFATHLSGSFGESKCRAVIHRLGFAAPELQVKFSDSEGDMFTDFFWRGLNKAAEFDGKVKYLRPEFNHGDPAEAVWLEKQREDRLRRQIDGVVRILSSHVANPPSLNALLLEAGIPKVGGRK